MDRDLTKQELVHLFRHARGLHLFEHQRCCSLRLAPHTDAGPVSVDPTETPRDNITIYQFDLKTVTLGGESWAYVSCGLMVIVPPFPWLGYEFLSGHIW